MIGIDTNIMVRLLARDNEDQFAKSVALVERTPSDAPLFVNPLVAAEVVWVLERRLGVARDVARSRVGELVDSVEFSMPDRLETSAWRAWFEQPHADFFDVVIAATNKESGCDCTYTFDERAAKTVPGMELLT